MKTKRFNKLTLWALVAVMLSAFAFSVGAENSHSHAVCGSLTCAQDHNLDGISENCAEAVWTPITKLSDITAKGNYYITADFSLSYFDRSINDVGETVNLCLNGQSVIYSSTVSISGNVNICDCGGGSFSSPITNYGTINLYGGTIGESITNKDNATLNIYGGKITGEIQNDRNIATAAINMYGGEISGARITNRAGSLNIKGGSITNAGQCVFHEGGTAIISGNPVLTGTSNYATVDAYADITILGGTFKNTGAVSTLISQKASATVTVKGGEFTSTGTVITGNQGTTNIEDGIFKSETGQYVIKAHSAVNISGGTFSTGSSEAYIYVRRATGADVPLSVSGGMFKYGIKLDYYRNNGYTSAYLNDILKDGYAYYQDNEVLVLDSPYKTSVTGSDVIIAEIPNSETYTIVFDANGGEVSTESATTNIKCQLNNLPVPTRENYDFLGWFDAQTGGTQITEETIFTENKTIYAQWKLKTYNIIYVLYDDIIIEDSYTYGEDVELPDDAEREGYRFRGWYKDQSYTDGPYGKIVQSSVDFTFYAKWSPEYNVAIAETQNGKVLADITGAIENETVTLTVIPDNFYDLVSIAVKNEGNDNILLSGDGYERTFKMPAENVTVTAVFERAKVSFNANGGTGEMENVVVTDEAGIYQLPDCGFTAPETSVPGGMAFVGWALSEDGEVISGNTVLVTKNIELFAIWKYVPELEQTIKRNGSFREICTFNIDLGALLPPDAILEQGFEVSSGGIGIEGVTPNTQLGSNKASLKIVTREASVPLTDFVTITLTTSNYGDFKFTVNVELTDFEIQDYDKTTKSANIWFAQAGTYTVIFADYNSNRLVNIKSTQMAVEEDKAGAITVEMDNITLDAGDKIMLWSGDFVSLVPKCNTYIIP